MKQTVKRYALAIVILHWLMALMIIAMLLAGHFITAATPNSDPEKLNHLRGHMIMGMAVGVFLILRLIMRIITQKPEAAHTGLSWADKLAPLTHYGFYVLLLVQVGSGIGMSIGANLPEIIFNGNGSLPPDFWSFTSRVYHRVAALVLAAMIVLHVAAALYHQFFLKDGLLSRMWIGKRD